MKYNRVLSIAGSDSGGGAGIQADIKSISANGAYAMTAITAITSQNTLGVQDVYPLPASVVASQITSVITDIGVDAVKIGMLHSTEIITCVSDALRKLQAPNIVLDPVMVATSGDSLFRNDALDALKALLIPISSLITPNLPEAEALAGKTVSTIEEMKQVAQQLSFDNKVSVLVKGGHLIAKHELCDVLYDATTGKLTEFYSEKVETNNTHGTGCTLSSAIAAYLAQSYSMVDAVQLAKKYISAAIVAGSYYSIGAGHGPVHHFYKLDNNK